MTYVQIRLNIRLKYMSNYSNTNKKNLYFNFPVDSFICLLAIGKTNNIKEVVKTLCKYN